MSFKITISKIKVTLPIMILPQRSYVYKQLINNHLSIKSLNELDSFNILYNNKLSPIQRRIEQDKVLLNCLYFETSNYGQILRKLHKLNKLHDNTII